MREISYYRQQAERAKRLADTVTDQQASEALAATARDLAEIADDLERGAVEVRHPELVKQTQHSASNPDRGSPS